MTDHQDLMAGLAITALHSADHITEETEDEREDREWREYDRDGTVYA